MQIAHGDETEVKVVQGGVRGGTIGMQYLLFGDPASPGMFKFGLFHQSDGFFSPRHRHNFCQFRIQLQGQCEYGLSGKMPTGTIGYFPEGAYYGPQGPDTGDTFNATLQFGGPSGQGMVTIQQTAAAKTELDKIGAFKDGVFHRNTDVAGKKTMDGFEAVWEQVMGRPLVYPEPQYPAPVVMHPENYDWRRIPGAQGIEQKVLGVFTDCQIPCVLYRLAPGASYSLDGRAVLLVLSGRGAVAGNIYRKYTALYLETGEEARFKADLPTEIVLLGLPDVADMAQPFATEAAEYRGALRG